MAPPPDCWILLLWLLGHLFFHQKKKHKKHKHKGKQQQQTKNKKEASDSSSEDSDDEDGQVSTEELLKRSEVTSQTGEEY